MHEGRDLILSFQPRRWQKWAHLVPQITSVWYAMPKMQSHLRVETHRSVSSPHIILPPDPVQACISFSNKQQSAKQRDTCERYSTLASAVLGQSKSKSIAEHDGGKRSIKAPRKRKRVITILAKAQSVLSNFRPRATSKRETSVKNATKSMPHFQNFRPFSFFVSEE